MAQMIFDADWATEYGLYEGILLSGLLKIEVSLAGQGARDEHGNIEYECRRDGRIWIRCTYEDLAKWYPFLSVHQIKRIIASLLKQGAIVKGNYNDHPMDKTSWYARVALNHSERWLLAKKQAN